MVTISKVAETNMGICLITQVDKIDAPIMATIGLDLLGLNYMHQWIPEISMRQDKRIVDAS